MTHRMKCWALWWLIFVFQHNKIICGNGNGQGNATGQSHANGQGNRNGQSHANGQGNTNGQSHANGQGNTNGQSHANGQGNTNGQSHANEQGNTNGQSHANGQGNTNGQCNPNSQGHTNKSFSNNINISTGCLLKNIQSGRMNPKLCLTHMSNGRFNGLEIYANDSEVMVNTDLLKRKVKVSLPKELDVGESDTIDFTITQLLNETALTDSYELYEGMLVSLSVSGKNISGLQERINITKTQEPQCFYINTLTETFGSNGCLTLWDHDLNEITCSCDHLTFFGVLLVSKGNVSSVDQAVLSYITIIGCSVSLFALVLTVLIFITKRKLRENDSKKIHISLSVALILLNLHFLPSEAVAASSLDGFCVYMGLGLHYSLLATFSWMALEGLHLYLLLVKVLNIYIRRYLLKLSLVGWGVPAVIVSVVVIIDKDYYGHAPVDMSNPNGSAICYLTNETVKLGSTVGVFALVFLFNVIMFGITIKWFAKARSSKEIGKSARNSARKEICTLLSVMVLLGITWGLIFFSFGPLTTPGLYAFCILNSLQGFVIFIYFILSLKKPKDSSQSNKTSTSRT